ncbi:retinol dehydrogenase 11-like [Ostrinia nubilalis]|uniref:retinol dehydrogenase 11-like n=1 Tax=Ostrinia nubilalis TaxID=29057 RepID=UPI0030825B89
MDYLSGWCRSSRRLDGLTAIVTGCNTGIGKETVADLYKRGARVIMACRDINKANTAKDQIEHAAGTDKKGVLVVEKLDLSSLKSVREFADRISASENRIDILVNNAGVMMCLEGKTEDGHETHIGTNHLGHALLTLLLLPRLKENDASRIVFVSSYLHAKHVVDLEDMNFEKTRYDPYTAYCRSKAANILFSKALAMELKKRDISNVTTYSLHPGVISTEIGRHFSESYMWGTSWLFAAIMRLFGKSVKCGAQTSIYCAVDEACAAESGLYYSECAVTTPSKQCRDDEFAAKFWDWTIKTLDFHSYDPFRTK